MTLQIWPSLDGYRLVFAKAETFETLGVFRTWDEVVEAKKAAEILSKTSTWRT